MGKVHHDLEQGDARIQLHQHILQRSKQAALNKLRPLCNKKLRIGNLLEKQKKRDESSGKHAVQKKMAVASPIQQQGAPGKDTKEREHRNHHAPGDEFPGKHGNLSPAQVCSKIREIGLKHRAKAKK